MRIPRKHLLHRLMVVTFATCTVICARSQNKEANSQINFTARTDLVMIPVIVTDKSGNHITGLRKEDFKVRENGSERQIATFEEIRTDQHPLSPPANPNEFSNVVAGQPSTSRITLIVLDLLNTSFAAQAAGRRDLLKYLTQSVDVREPTGLYTLTRNGIQVIHDFTTDPRILVAALHKVKGDSYQMVDSPGEVEAITGTASPDGTAGDSNASTNQSSKGSGQANLQAEASKMQMLLGNAELNFQSFEQRLAITYTLDGLQQLAQALAGIPGRKSLIWAGGGFPFNVSDNSMQLVPPGRDSISDVLPLYERTWQLLNDAHVSLYPVDVNGLETVTTASASLRNPGKNFGRNMNSRQLDTQATLEIFASATGGRAYFNSNDLIKGFRDAVNDSSQYYMLGYYLDYSHSKSGWRKLSVKVTRDHTEVRARSGFFVTDSRLHPESSRKSDISAALYSSLDYTSLPLVARWGKFEPANNPGQKYVRYELHFSPDVDLINASDNNHLVVDIVTQAFTPDGKSAGNPRAQTIDLHLSPERAALIRKNGLIFREVVNLGPGEYRVRFVARDDFTGRMGSVAAPLKVE
jgi:VWFA-related protein